MTKSELSGLIEGNILNYMKRNGEKFSQRSKIYSSLSKRDDIKETVSETNKLIKESKKPEVKDSLKRLKDEKLKELSEVEEGHGVLEERLMLPIVINHLPKKTRKIDVILALHYKEKEAGLTQSLYQAVMSATKTSEVLDYSGLTVIRTSKSNLKRIIEKIESLRNEKDFKKANIGFYDVDEFRLMLAQGKVEEKEKIERKKEKKAEYTTDDIRKKLGLKHISSTDHIVKKYLESKGIKIKGHGKYKFTEKEYQDVIDFWQERRAKRREKKYVLKDVRERRAGRRERTYLIADVVEALGLSRTAATSRVSRYLKREGITHKGKSYKLTKKQYKDIISKGAVPKELREEIKKDVIAGLKADEIFEKYKNSYRPGVISGTINLMIHHYRKK